MLLGSLIRLLVTPFPPTFPCLSAVRGLVRQVQQGIETSGQAPPVQYDHFIRILMCLRRSRRDWMAGFGAGPCVITENPQLVDVAVAANILGLQPPVMDPPQSPSKTAGQLRVDREAAWVPGLVLRDLNKCEQVSTHLMGHARFHAFSALELAVMHGRAQAAQTLLAHGVAVDAGYVDM